MSVKCYPQQQGCSEFLQPSRLFIKKLLDTPLPSDSPQLPTCLSAPRICLSVFLASQPVLRHFQWTSLAVCLPPPLECCPQHSDSLFASPPARCRTAAGQGTHGAKRENPRDGWLRKGRNDALRTKVTEKLEATRRKANAQETAPKAKNRTRREKKGQVKTNSKKKTPDTLDARNEVRHTNTKTALASSTKVPTVFPHQLLSPLCPPPSLPARAASLRKLPSSQAPCQRDKAHDSLSSFAARSGRLIQDRQAAHTPSRGPRRRLTVEILRIHSRPSLGLGLRVYVSANCLTIVPPSPPGSPFMAIQLH